jgi:hypothetical protein
VKSTENVNISKYMTGSTPISEARFGMLDEFPILEVSPFPSALYHPTIFTLVITPYIHIYIWVMGDNQRTPRYALLDPKLAVESISEVPGASKAHLEVVGFLNGAVP